MNIHSVALTAVPRRDSTPGPKRDAILRAAIDVFAERGFFSAQVADIARAAGVAAGTVYLYFKSKDDLLVSIFDRSMREGLTLGRAAVADLDDPRERLRRLADHVTAEQPTTPRRVLRAVALVAVPRAPASARW